MGVHGRPRWASGVDARRFIPPHPASLFSAFEPRCQLSASREHPACASSSSFVPACFTACFTAPLPPPLSTPQGIEVLNQAVEVCKASIEAAKGRMVVKEAARAVSEKEERALEEELQVGRDAWLPHWLGWVFGGQGGRAASCLHACGSVPSMSMGPTVGQTASYYKGSQSNCQCPAWPCLVPAGGRGCQP